MDNITYDVPAIYWKAESKLLPNSFDSVEHDDTREERLERSSDNIICQSSLIRSRDFPSKLGLSRGDSSLSPSAERVSPPMMNAQYKLSEKTSKNISKLTCEEESGERPEDRRRTLRGRLRGHVEEGVRFMSKLGEKEISEEKVRQIDVLCRFPMSFMLTKKSDDPSKGSSKYVDHTDRNEALCQFSHLSIRNESKSIGGNTLQDRFRLCTESIESGAWNTVLAFVARNPELLNVSSRKENRTLLHTLLLQDVFVPEKVMSRMLALCSGVINYVDIYGCTPLHYAASVGHHADLLPILLEKSKEAASQPNLDGDLPLHVAALGGKGTELNAQILMSCYPQAVGIMNNLGCLPIHSARKARNVSQTTVHKLLQLQNELGISIDHVNLNDNLAQHDDRNEIAANNMLLLAPVKKDLEISEHSLSGHAIGSEKGMSPTQNTLTTHVRGPRLISPMLTVRYDSVRLAIKKKSPDTIIFERLKNEMPIKLGNIGSDGFTRILRQGSSSSWWMVATEREGKYTRVVDQVLQNATFSEIIALARIVGEDGETSVFDVAHPSVMKSFCMNMFLCDCYELALKTPENEVGLLIFRGFYYPVKSGEVTLNQANECTTSMLSNGSQLEVIVKPHVQQEVSLHCSKVGSSEDALLLLEIYMRQKFNFSNKYCQALINHHVLDGQRFGCIGTKVRCIALERPFLTLSGVLERHRFRKRKDAGWFRKSRNVLKHTACALKYIHECGFIHGWIGPHVIARFGDNEWKITRIGGLRRIGEQMEGALRSGVPPESVRESKQTIAPSHRKVHVSFNDNIFPMRLNSEVSADGNIKVRAHHPHLLFSPAYCNADVSWDAWSFGLIMGQLLLGQSATVLPNFDRASDVHLQRLFTYDHESREVIKVATEKRAGTQAADLIGKLLDPCPSKRPDMKVVLSHKYFSDIVPAN